MNAALSPTRFPWPRVRLSLGGLLLASAGNCGAEVDFGRDVQPVLSEYCYPCHGPDANARKSKLRLDLREGALGTSTASGLPAIVPGAAEESELLRRLLSEDPDEVMPPPKVKLRPGRAEIAVLRKWIEAGAPWGQHWSFEPVRAPPPPDLGAGGKRPGGGVWAGWPRGAIDGFVGARLRAEGLAPSPEAGRPALVRRVTLALTGLPPTPREVAVFVADRRPGAYGRVVDRLLASPRYGERMAWDWLEAARYADSNGYQGDRERTMWPWRDWVVEAFNRNLPYDQFTVWQLAGDLLPGATEEQVLATGFCRNHPINGEGGRIAEENRVDYVMDMAETAGTIWLGLTFNCCRCHDHKFDPLSQRDYYQLFAFFNQTPVNGGGGDPQTPPRIEYVPPLEKIRLALLGEERAAAAGAVEGREVERFPRGEGEPASASPAAAKLPEEARKTLDKTPAHRSAEELKKLLEHLAKAAGEGGGAAAGDDRWEGYRRDLEKLRSAAGAIEGIHRAAPKVMVMEDRKDRRETRILQTGLYNKPLEPVGTDVPEHLPPLPGGAPRDRLGLARWMVSDDNPLAARVTVNRIWQQFFGTGLVKTAEDFGVQGEKPSHPDLLDWLAEDFRRGGWDIKRLCRQIVTSATYRQSSRTPAGLLERDPENRLLARGSRFRMPSWMLRDQALAAGGLLSTKVGGRPVNPYQPEGVWAEASFGKKRYSRDGGEALYRRSLYTFWRRIIGPTAFFDTASRTTCIVKPTRTNSPLHALTTLNDTGYVEAARGLARRVLSAEGATAREGDGAGAEAGAVQDRRRVAAVFEILLAREPSPEEAAVLLSGLRRNRAAFAADPGAAGRLLAVGESPPDPRLDPLEHAALTLTCATVMNLDEALSLE